MYIKVRETNKVVHCYNTLGPNSRYKESLCKEQNNTVSLYCDEINSEFCNDFRKCLN